MDDIKSQRLNDLHFWQKQYNMQPRDDSYLTGLFVNGHIDWPTDMVARELMCTDYIYKYTLYGEIIEEFMRCVAIHIKNEYNLSWTSTWNIVKFYGPIALKCICLSQTNNVIPNCLPEESPQHQTCNNMDTK